MTEKSQDAAADLLIQEVNDELRQEQLQNVWKRYGSLLIAAAVLSVAGVAGWQAYTGWQTKTRQTASADFTVAMQALEQGKTDDAARTLAKLAVDSPAGYQVLSRLKQADLAAKSGDLAAALSGFESVAAQTAYDPMLRDLARLKAAYLKLDLGDAAAAEQMVAGLSTESSPWRHSAREILALAAFKQGDKAKAAEWYGKVSDDGGAPMAIRTRATEMLAVLSAGTSR